MFMRSRVDFADPVLSRPMMAGASILREVSAGRLWDKQHAPDPDLRAEMFNWCLVHVFAQLTVEGMFDNDGMRDLEIGDILPEMSYRD